jgi:uncharacterized protein (TIGR02996 family)
MREEEGFLRAMLVSPEDARVRLVYADWLEERGDQRSAYLRLDAEAQGRQGKGKGGAGAQQRLQELEVTLDPGWVAFMTTLGRPFRTGPVSREFFDCEPSELPFTETIGWRGRLITFEPQFRSEGAWEPNLLEDLKLLTQLELGHCAYGAGSIPVHPFICELDTGRWPLTGADVLRALKARNFRSRHIPTLEATRIAFPGYHPGEDGPDNDEIHNDFAEQHIFSTGGDDDIEPEDELSGEHGALKQSVVDGQLWYVLLHITPEQVAEFLFSRYVVLFAVGRSMYGSRLLGVVTHQVCHNLCD